MNLNLLLAPTTLSATYNCNAYGSGAYNEGQETANCTTATPTKPDGGTLVDTGSPYFVPLAAGVLLVMVALGLIVAKLVKHSRLSAAAKRR